MTGALGSGLVPDRPPCTHPDGHWTKIASPNGPTSPAVCLRCGLETDQRNSLETRSGWGPNYQNDVLRREANATLGSILRDLEKR